MKKILGQLQRTGEMFMDGFVKAAGMSEVVIASVVIGLRQGLKYKGNLKAGLIATGATWGILGAITGVQAVFQNFDYIRQKET